MARHKGESVAFTAFYGRNLKSLARLLERITQEKNTTSIKVFAELMTSQTSIFIASYTTFNSLTRAILTARKVFSSNFVAYGCIGKKIPE
jgi:hypothetical protein